MYNNYRDNRGNNGGFSNGGRRYGGFQDRPKHDAKCDGCGEMCQVPFIPNGSKPVYCRNCFKKDDMGRVTGPQHTFERPAFQARSNGPDMGKMEARLARIEEKLDALIEALTEDVEDEEGGEESADANAI